MIAKPDEGIAFGQEHWGNTLTQAKGADFFTGSTQTDNHPVDPLITGFAFIKWIKVPDWVEDKAIGFDGFRSLTEKNLRAFSGNDDIELGTLGVQSGFTASETMAIAGITKSQGFSMTHREWSGSPLRHVYNHWVSGIRDPETGVATYCKQYKKEYSARNHTGELLYVMTRPDADNADNGHVIEFAQYYTNVMPTKLLLGHLNYTAGTNDGVEFEQTFTGNRHQSPAVDVFAEKQLKNMYKFKHESDFASSNFNGA